MFSCVQLFVTLWMARLLCPWDFPGNNTGVDSHFLIQDIFLTQGSNLHLVRFLHGKVDSIPLSHLGSPRNGVWTVTFLHRNVFPKREFHQLSLHSYPLLGNARQRSPELFLFPSATALNPPSSFRNQPSEPSFILLHPIYIHPIYNPFHPHVLEIEG